MLAVRARGDRQRRSSMLAGRQGPTSGMVVRLAQNTNPQPMVQPLKSSANM
jgi:hypothetical protein